MKTHPMMGSRAMEEVPLLCLKARWHGDPFGCRLPKGHAGPHAGERPTTAEDLAWAFDIFRWPIAVTVALGALAATT